jgi:hypothetical protein
MRGTPKGPDYFPKINPPESPSKGESLSAPGKTRKMPGIHSDEAILVLPGPSPCCD